jgi:hypothetical protein
MSRQVNTKGGGDYANFKVGAVVGIGVSVLIMVIIYVGEDSG